MSEEREERPYCGYSVKADEELFHYERKSSVLHINFKKSVYSL